MDSARDVVAIFVAEFQAVQGNIIDWSCLVDESISLNSVEFNVLPSGIHSVDKDVIYFTKDAYYGVSVYRRIATEEVGMRGARMISVGVLVANTRRPRPWNHISALKRFAVHLEDDMSNKEPLERYFNDRKVADLTSLDEPSWDGWESELNESTMVHPLLHLPHVLRVLGISTLTLFKHALGRRRILIYTHTPVEPACLLAQLAAVVCVGEQANGNNTAIRPRVLGLVGLTDLPRIEQETSKGEGWIACTTDALFLEKPRLFDLLIDLTTSAQSNLRKPSLSVSRAFTNGSGKQEYKLQTVRFTWSDVKIWNELERITDIYATQNSSNGDSSSNKSRWTDPWMMYEDMCLVCAHIWMGGQSSPSIKLDSTAALLESRSSSPGPIMPGSDSQSQPSSSMKTLGRSSEDPRLADAQPVVPSAKAKTTTLCLVSVLHNHAEFLLSRLSEMVPLVDEDEGIIEGDSAPVILGPKEVLAFGLGPMSDLDARFIEWIGERRNRKVKVRRSWKDLAAFMLGLS